MKKQKSSKKVVIEVSGGCVTEIYSNDPGISVVLADWGSIRDGKNAAVLPLTPFVALPDDTRKAVAKILGEKWIK